MNKTTNVMYMPRHDYSHPVVALQQNFIAKSIAFKVINNVMKRNQILKKKNLAKIKLFAGICKSDKFTLEQSYEDFAHISLTQSADS